MIKGVERLFEAITGPEWRMENEETGELVKYNFDRTRKLSYEGIGAGGDDVFATMEMSFLDENGGWIEMFVLRHFSFSYVGRDGMMITAVARPREKDGQPVKYRYSESGRYFYGDGRRWENTSNPRIFEDRQELCPACDEMPERIDLVLTASLFVDQLTRGEMERPVLVPEGYFPYEEPEEITYGAVTYSPNVARVGRLIADARNSEELRMAQRIFLFVMAQEPATKSGE